MGVCGAGVHIPTEQRGQGLRSDTSRFPHLRDALSLWVLWERFGRGARCAGDCWSPVGHPAWDPTHRAPHAGWDTPYGTPHLDHSVWGTPRGMQHNRAPCMGPSTWGTLHGAQHVGHVARDRLGMVGLTLALTSQVWFQNRRAKWRRQEKMEASSMKLHDTPVLSFNRPPMTPNVGPMSNSLPLDPWLTSPISSATTVHSIPGFMGAPQALQPPYGGHSFLNTPPPMAQGMQPMAPAPYQCGTTFVDKYPLEEVDQRSSSIASLRMKAKEHIQTIDKTWQPI